MTFSLRSNEGVRSVTAVGIIFADVVLVGGYLPHWGDFGDKNGSNLIP